MGRGPLKTFTNWQECGLSFCRYMTACLFTSAIMYLTLIVTARMTSLLIVSLPCAQQMLLIPPATPPVLLPIPLLRPVAICLGSLSADVPRVLCILLLIIAVPHILPSISIICILRVVQAAILQSQPP